MVLFLARGSLSMPHVKSVRFKSLIIFGGWFNFALELIHYLSVSFQWSLAKKKNKPKQFNWPSNVWVFYLSIAQAAQYSEQINLYLNSQISKLLRCETFFHSLSLNSYSPKTSYGLFNIHFFLYFFGHINNYEEEREIKYISIYR